MKRSSNLVMLRETTVETVVKTLNLLYHLNLLNWDEMVTIKTVLHNVTMHAKVDPEPKERLITIKELSRLLSLGQTTLYRHLASGELQIPKVRVGGAVRFRMSDVTRYMEKRSGSDNLN